MPQVIAQVGPDDLHLVAAQYRFLTGQEVIQNKPTLASISPATKVAGSAQFTLTATGTNFVTGLSKIYWGADPVATTFVSATSLTAVIPASAVATPGTIPVTVVTGSLASESRNFEVTAASADVESVPQSEPEPESEPEPAAEAVEVGPAPEEPAEEEPNSLWLKADIIAWIETSDIDTGDLNLANLTKAELLELI